jgi:hypothetical protein
MLGRIRRVLRWALCALVVFGLVPGATELVENLEHLLHDGHLRHSTAHEVVADDEACDGEGDEHGCTPLDHRCGCCTSVAGIAGVRDPLSQPLPSEARPEVRSTIIQRPVSRDVSPPVRPPIT